MVVGHVEQHRTPGGCHTEGGYAALRSLGPTGLGLAALPWRGFESITGAFLGVPVIELTLSSPSPRVCPNLVPCSGRGVLLSTLHTPLLSKSCKIVLNECVQSWSPTRLLPCVPPSSPDSSLLGRHLLPGWLHPLPFLSTPSSHMVTRCSSSQPGGPSHPCIRAPGDPFTPTSKTPRSALGVCLPLVPLFLPCCGGTPASSSLCSQFRGLGTHVESFRDQEGRSSVGPFHLTASRFTFSLAFLSPPRPPGAAKPESRSWG